MKTRYLHASWLSTVELPNGTIGLRVYGEKNDSLIPNLMVFTTKRQMAGLRKQIPIKLRPLKTKGA